MSFEIQMKIEFLPPNNGSKKCLEESLGLMIQFVHMYISLCIFVCMYVRVYICYSENEKFGNYPYQRATLQNVQSNWVMLIMVDVLSNLLVVLHNYYQGWRI